MTLPIPAGLDPAAVAVIYRGEDDPAWLPGERPVVDTQSRTATAWVRHFSQVGLGWQPAFLSEVRFADLQVDVAAGRLRVSYAVDSAWPSLENLGPSAS